ncbi:MAG: alanine dehydrogenase [bacterium]|nr:alanine dehydrogenase [bacterium]
MKVGVVRETKTDENRVALTPAGVHALVEDGHEVLVEAGAGLGSQISDDEYSTEGGRLIGSATDVWGGADIIVKVKEPQNSEFQYLRENLILFTYLHLAAYPEVANALVASGTDSIAYETVQLPDHTLPLLAPMSEVAGRMSIQVGARFLEKFAGGRGVLLGGVPGVQPGKVTIIGGGMAGSNAAQMAFGLGADVTVFDLSPVPLRHIDQIYHGAIKTKVANPLDVRNAAAESDLVVGAVLLPGAKAPRILNAADVAAMKEGSVLVDISIDQGGCFETSHETKHSDPTYVLDGVIHYAVGNIPGAVPRTSTFALTNVTLPYLRMLATHGIDGSVAIRPELHDGINTRNGAIVNEIVAAALAE